jgi:hypothetical protein
MEAREIAEDREQDPFGLALLAVLGAVHGDAALYRPKVDIPALKAAGPAPLLAEIDSPAIVEPPGVKFNGTRSRL